MIPGCQRGALVDDQANTKYHAARGFGLIRQGCYHTASSRFKVLFISSTPFTRFSLTARLFADLSRALFSRLSTPFTIQFFNLTSAAT